MDEKLCTFIFLQEDFDNFVKPSYIHSEENNDSPWESLLDADFWNNKDIVETQFSYLSEHNVWDDYIERTYPLNSNGLAVTIYLKTLSRLLAFLNDFSSKLNLSALQTLQIRSAIARFSIVDILSKLIGNAAKINEDEVGLLALCLIGHGCPTEYWENQIHELWNENESKNGRVLIRATILAALKLALNKANIEIEDYQNLSLRVRSALEAVRTSSELIWSDIWKEIMFDLQGQPELRALAFIVHPIRAMNISEQNNYFSELEPLLRKMSKREKKLFKSKFL